MQIIARGRSFDAGHRVLNERMKCYNIHGHTYLYELAFSFEQMKEIGYPIDFKEIKRVGEEWIQDYLDHGFIANPEDEISIKACKDSGSKLWLMGLNAGGFCNPTVENVSKEIFLAMRILFEKHEHISAHSVKLYETPNCYTICTLDSISEVEMQNFYAKNQADISAYSSKKGIFEYDTTKTK